VPDLVGLLLAADQVEDARQEAQGLLAPELPAAGRRVGRHELIKVLATAGRRSEALRMARGENLDPGQSGSADEHDPVVGLLARDADPAEMAREVRAARREDPTVVQLAALVAYAGDLPLAAELAVDLDGPWKAVYEGVVAWRAGRFDEALALLARAAVPRQGPRLLAEYLRGDLLFERGRHREAVDQLRRFVGRADWPYWPMWRSWAHPRARLLLAQSLAALGRSEEARAEVDGLLRSWSGADAGLPDLVAARDLRARLQ